MSMPGGGKIVTVNPFFSPGSYSLNNSGDVTFNPALDTGESGLYLYSRGSFQVIVRTGSVIPGVGTVVSATTGHSGGALNDSGELFFWATLTDGNGVLLVATPH
jgi:hypothetical protein